MGINTVADLFFETQFILSESADYNDLYVALGAASINLGLSFNERQNIMRAGRAVEIVLGAVGGVEKTVFDGGLLLVAAGELQQHAAVAPRHPRPRGGAVVDESANRPALADGTVAQPERFRTPN